MLRSYWAYSGCDTLPLSVFLEVLETGNTKKLVRFGIMPEKKRTDLWEKIFEEFREMIKDTSQVHSFSIMRFITYQRTKILILTHCMKSLMIQYNEKVADVIRAFGFQMAEGRMMKDLKRINGQIKRMEVEIEEKEAELAKMEDVQGEKDALRLLILSASKFQGYRIDPPKTTVKEFALILDNYKKEKKWQQGKLQNSLMNHPSSNLSS